MDIDFINERLKKELTEDKKLRKKHGPRRAELIGQRLGEIEASPNLSILRKLPGPRCHELKGNMKGQLSVDLDHPYRMIFEPNHNPVPQLTAGGMDWNLITSVTILGVTDTHE